MRCSLCVLAALGLSASVQAAEWSQRFAVSGRPELRVDANDVEVTVRAGPARAVEARVTTQGWQVGPGGVSVAARQSGPRVEIAVLVPSGEWGVGRRWVRLEVTVPQELRAEIRTTEGRIRAQGLRGEFRFVTEDGAIEAESLDGAMRARTSAGKTTVRGRFDRLELRTDDGSVVAELSPGSKPAGRWRIETGDGNVTVRVAADFAANLDAATGDGEITVQPAVNSTGVEQGERSLRGKLNGGGQVLRIRTGDGSIRLERF